MSSKGTGELSVRQLLPQTLSGKGLNFTEQTMVASKGGEGLGTGDPKEGILLPLLGRVLFRSGVCQPAAVGVLPVC